jgi:hypothetical protein
MVLRFSANQSPQTRQKRLAYELMICPKKGKVCTPFALLSFCFLHKKPKKPLLYSPCKLHLTLLQ